jgi:hypothetical protein
LQLVDVAGKNQQLIFNGDLSAGNNSVTVDLQKFPEGIYFLKLSAEGKTSVLKLGKLE